MFGVTEIRKQILYHTLSYWFLKNLIRTCWKRGADFQHLLLIFSTFFSNTCWFSAPVIYLQQQQLLIYNTTC